jgi:hypothetical protein
MAILALSNLFQINEKTYQHPDMVYFIGTLSQKNR